MGYLTTYSLETKTSSYVYDILKTIPKDSKNFTGIGYAIDVYGDSIDSVKWYDHEKEMAWLSKQFQNEIFVLTGEGEDNYDTWQKYFCNGKMQVCHAIITFPKFDPNKLKEV